MLMLHSRPVAVSWPITPAADPVMSPNALALWLALRERGQITDKRVAAEHELRCSTGDALAAVHELVADGWIAVRWISEDEAFVALVTWTIDDFAVSKVGWEGASR